MHKKMQTVLNIHFNAAILELRFSSILAEVNTEPESIDKYFYECKI